MATTLFKDVYKSSCVCMCVENFYEIIENIKKIIFLTAPC